MEFLSSDERAALLEALGMSASEYAAVSAAHREASQASADPQKTAIFLAARLGSTKGGRDQAFDRFNRFLDALNPQGAR